MRTANIFLLHAFIALAVSLVLSLPVSVRQEWIEEEDEPAPSGEPWREPIDIFGSLPIKTVGKSFKINCGGDKFGEFEPDFYRWLSAGSGSYHAPMTTVVGTEEMPATIFQSHRYGLNGMPFSYKLPVEFSGIYECTLHFAEAFVEYQIVGGRVFSVGASGNAGTEWATDIDVWAESGMDASVVIIRSFTISALDTINFLFEASTAEAMVSAISCTQVAEL